MVASWGRIGRSGALGWLVVAACGPTVTLEDDGATPEASSSTGSATTTTSATLPMTSVGDVTSVGPLDSGGDDVRLDLYFPESCSTIEQDCPPGYKCMPWASDDASVWNDTKCVEVVEDPSGVGEPCTVIGSVLDGKDDCDGSSMCWDVNPETSEGTCTPFCTGTEDRPTCAEPCDVCSIAGKGLITLCYTPCDPLVQDCPMGQACYYEMYVDKFSCGPDASGREGGIASPCEYTNVCDPGLACLDASTVPGCPDGSAGCCTPYCAVGGPDPCPGLLPGSTCVPLLEDGEGPSEACLIAPVGVCLQE